MLDSARLIIEYLYGVTRDDFEQQVAIRDSVLWRLMIIGEAAKNVSQEFRQAHPAASRN